LKGHKEIIGCHSIFEKLIEVVDDEKDDNDKMIMQYQEEKIKELTKICSGLSNKISPSSLLHLSLLDSNLDDIELELNRSLHLCIRALIQILSPIKPIIEWIIENNFLIVKGITPDDPFQQLANTWLWDGILKYESLENVQKSEILQIFGYKIKELCEKNDQIFGTRFTTATDNNTHHPQSVFIPPPPQRILDMIIQQHYNHFIDDLGLKKGEGMHDLPNLPFKKIQLVPPANTKPFGKVSFCSWRPSLFSSPTIHTAEDSEDIEREADILFAELAWNKDKLTYVHFAWPQYGEEVVILEKGWHYYSSSSPESRETTTLKTTQSDYQMIGVIWGKQFVDKVWVRQDGLLPHLGLNNPPVSYIYATKRNTSPENPNQGKWYLCLDDNYISHFKPKELTNNFQDVLLYMNNDQRRTYRPQLLVFQKLQLRRQIPASIGLHDDYHLIETRGGGGKEGVECCCSPVSIESYEPNLQKKIWVDNKEMRKKKSTSLLLKPGAQLTSKKQVTETIDAIINASTKEADLDEMQYRFFGYDKESQYQKGPNGFQLTQTHDQKGYYNCLHSKKW
jgi:hypothetical protein